MHENGAGRNVSLDVPQINLGQRDDESRRAGGSRRRASGRRKGGMFSSWRLTVAFGLGLITLTGAALLVISIADPMAPPGAWSPLAWVHDARASHYIDQRRPSPADLSQADAESWTALSQSPVDDVAWLNLASSDRLRHGVLTGRGLLALKRSYDIAPFAAALSHWRIRFALENWGDLTPELRNDVIQEARTYGGRNRYYLLQTLRGIRDPAGQLAANLILSLVDLEHAKTP